MQLFNLLPPELYSTALVNTPLKNPLEQDKLVPKAFQSPTLATAGTWAVNINILNVREREEASPEGRSIVLRLSEVAACSCYVHELAWSIRHCETISGPKPNGSCKKTLGASDIASGTIKKRTRMPEGRNSETPNGNTMEKRSTL